MSLSEEKNQTPRTRRKIKYIIVASADGEIHGAFKPTESVRAQEYLEKVQKKEPKLKISIHRVSNLNQFKANLRYGKKSKRPTASRNPNDGSNLPLVEKANENSSESD
jgi:fructose/tagatose bisphosphate aldolase